MRIMDDLIHEHGLDEELEDRLVEATGNTNFWLGPDPEHMDEPSDAEDPEEQLRATVDGLRAEAADRQAMVQAVQGAQECRSGNPVGHGRRDGRDRQSPALAMARSVLGYSGSRQTSGSGPVRS